MHTFKLVLVCICLTYQTQSDHPSSGCSTNGWAVVKVKISRPFGTTKNGKLPSGYD